MGHANVWIRKENEDHWDKKGNHKSEWLNNKLKKEADAEAKDVKTEGVTFQEAHDFGDYDPPSSQVSF